jgi:hypothetical protein
LSTGTEGVESVDKLIIYDVPEPNAFNVPLTETIIFELLPVPFVDVKENSPCGSKSFFPDGTVTVRDVLSDAL